MLLQIPEVWVQVFHTNLFPHISYKCLQVFTTGLLFTSRWDFYSLWNKERGLKWPKKKSISIEGSTSHFNNRCFLMWNVFFFFFFSWSFYEAVFLVSCVIERRQTQLLHSQSAPPSRCSDQLLSFNRKHSSWSFSLQTLTQPAHTVCLLVLAEHLETRYCLPTDLLQCSTVQEMMWFCFLHVFACECPSAQVVPCLKAPLAEAWQLEAPAQRLRSCCRETSVFSESLRGTWKTGIPSGRNFKGWVD